MEKKLESEMAQDLESEKAKETVKRLRLESRLEQVQEIELG